MGKLEIDPPTAKALGLTRPDRNAVAFRLAEIGDLQAPARTETRDFLVEVLIGALSAIPAADVAWSWGEFHNRGLQPLYDMNDAHDWPNLAACAVDLGLGEHPVAGRDGKVLSPLAQLSAALVESTENLLARIRQRLEDVGVSPEGSPDQADPADRDA
jgi:hypothetical protein